VQGEADNFALLSWAHTFANNAVLTSSFLYHFDRADYDGGAGDYPTITTYHHSSQYEGGEEQLKWDTSAAIVWMPASSASPSRIEADFNLGFADSSSPTLSELERPTGGLIAAWVQDTFAVTHWLNLSAGVRQSHFQSSFTENATDPRLGATVQLPHLDWVLSAFWGKYYQAPPLETCRGPWSPMRPRTTPPSCRCTESATRSGCSA
jgi:outer membrane receptor protein involved in Fe transport